MELGDPSTCEPAERSRLDVVLDKLNADFAELLEKVESGGLDHLSAAEKAAWWQRFETFRSRLPLIDHTLIADAEASNLAGEYSFSNLSRFWCRCSSSPSEATSRVGAGCCRGRTPHLHARRAAGASVAETGRVATVPSPPRSCRLWSGPCTSLETADAASPAAPTRPAGLIGTTSAIGLMVGRLI